jgi:hypothetical protein
VLIYVPKLPEGETERARPLTPGDGKVPVPLPVLSAGLPEEPLPRPAPPLK